jgi:hypothetical protein
MTTITLPPEIEGPLVEQAHKRGIPPEQLALDSLRALFAPNVQEENAAEGTLLDFLDGYIGTINGTTEALSEDTSRYFTEGLMEKRRQGHL